MPIVLYVDDEPSLCRAFERALRGPDIVIHTAPSPAAALRLLDEVQFDLVATDFRMPEMNGLDLLRRVRERQPRARLLLVSGQVDVEDDGQLDLSIVDGVLQKPWSLDELRRLIYSGDGTARTNSPPAADTVSADGS